MTKNSPVPAVSASEALADAMSDWEAAKSEGPGGSGPLFRNPPLDGDSSAAGGTGGSGDESPTQIPGSVLEEVLSAVEKDANFLKHWPGSFSTF